ncbi:MAG: CdaR family protein [Candidatus Binatus sp.]|uniref:CdaR family protein n=1 Tax=Candidatus Binatus sp. TaxID=2811406 RepID=UPI00271DF6EC|nr:CdaR family protein [Candidatus Binatus sp.]MDO8434827.1 CdaR family protein [Candidatus Binatus sp.]
MRIANLKKWIGLGRGGVFRFSETGLRVLSIALAIGLWVFVNAGERGSVMPLTVPISYRSLPAGLAIMNHPPDFVTIEVAGPRTLLSLLEPERLSLRLDLRGVAPGQSDFKIYPAMFNVPRQTSVTRISPDQLSLDIDRLVSRDVPVKVALEGKVADGFKISAVEVRPPTVSINGPGRYVSQVTQVETQPFDVKGLSADIERSIELAGWNPAVRYSVTRVEARVEVGEQIADREFKGVKVEVKDPDYRFRVDPKQATLTIRGPRLKLSSLDAKGIAYVDAKGMMPGSHELPLQIALPDGMQLVHQSPDKVRLRVYRERLTISADEQHPS